jgi:hypothetical protein
MRCTNVSKKRKTTVSTTNQDRRILAWGHASSQPLFHLPHSLWLQSGVCKGRPFGLVKRSLSLLLQELRGQPFVATVVRGANEVWYLTQYQESVWNTRWCQSTMSAEVSRLLPPELQEIILFRIVPLVRSRWIRRRVRDHHLWGQEKLSNHDHDLGSLQTVWKTTSPSKNWALGHSSDCKGHLDRAENERSAV